MATNYPTSLDSYSTKASGNTIAEGHINDPQDAIEAIEAKVGIDASTPIDARVLCGNGVGDSAWEQVNLADAVTGTLPVANGGTGSTSGWVFGAWTTQQNDVGGAGVANYTKDLIYLAATDGFLTARVEGTAKIVAGYTDGSNPPTTLRVHNGTDIVTSNSQHSITMPVKKGDYWKITSDDTPTIYWMPIGS